jgi:hypothetical protein
VRRSEEEDIAYKEYHYYKERVKHYTEALKNAKTDKRRVECEEGLKHYQQLFEEAKAKRKEN